MARQDMVRFVSAKVGDKLTVNVAKENRDWGYQPFPQGTEVEVVGFSPSYHGRVGSIGEPGIYANPQWIEVRDGSGKVEAVWTGFLERAPGHEGYRVPQSEMRIGDLPETYLWEWDIVRTARGEIVKVLGIEFGSIGKMRGDGVTPMPIYRCGDEGSYSSYQEEHVTLVERGPVWKRAHGIEFSFDSVGDEASFYIAVGEYDEVRNPATDNYRWTLEEALIAMEQGEIHGIKMGGMFGSSSVDAVRFHDEHVGERVRQKTLAGFCRGSKELLAYGATR